MDNKIDLMGKAGVSLQAEETPAQYQDAANVYVSEAFRRMVLGESLTKLYRNILGNPFGTIISFNNNVYSIGATYANKYKSLSGNITVAMLNLPSSFTPSQDLKYIPIIAADGSGLDNSVVTGYSLGELQSDLSKVGVLQGTTSPSQMANLSLLDNTYVWGTEKGNGTTNYVAILENTINNPYRSNIAFKCISSYNVYATNSSNVFGYILPDTKDTKGNVLTGPSQILTFERNVQSRWFYDVVTGEKRAVQPEEFAYNWNGRSGIGTGIINQVVYGDYLYVIRTAGTLAKISIEDGSIIAEKTISAGGSDRPFGIWVDGTSIKVSAFTTSTVESRAFIATVNPNSLTFTSVYNNVYTGWGNLPSNWVKRETNMQKVSDNYYIVANGEDAIICSDIMNVCGSIIGLIPSTGFNHFEVDNKIYQIYEQKDADAISLVINGTATNVSYNGVYISDSCYSNYWNIGSMNPVVTKQSGQELTLDIGFSLGYQAPTT